MDVISENMLTVFLMFLVLFGESVMKERQNPSTYFEEIFLECFVDTLNAFMQVLGNNLPVKLDVNEYIGRDQREISRELCWYYVMVGSVNGFWKTVAVKMIKTLSEEMRLSISEAAENVFAQDLQKRLQKYYMHCYYRYTYPDELTNDIKNYIQLRVKALIEQNIDNADIQAIVREDLEKQGLDIWPDSIQAYVSRCITKCKKELVLPVVVVNRYSYREWEEREEMEQQFQVLHARRKFLEEQ